MATRKIRLTTSTTRLGAGLLVGLLAMASLVSSAQASSVPLKTAAKFGVLAGSTVTNTGQSLIDGNVGVFPGTAVTGFPPGRLSFGSEIHRGDSVASKAQDDATGAYTSLMGRRPTEYVNQVNDGELGGRTLAPGVYSSLSFISLNGVLTLDAKGDPDAEFIFQAGSTLLVGTSTVSAVRLIGRAEADNVFWQVGSSATIGVDSHVVGTMLALTSITMKTRAILNGRAIALNGAVTLDGANGGAAVFPGDPAADTPSLRALRYVALGDSYSSGEGLGEDHGSYLTFGDSACHRHRLAYPELFRWQSRRTHLNFFACTGARTEHIYTKTQRHEPSPQAKRTALNKRTDLVTITIGGNNAGDPDGDGNGGLEKPLAFCWQHERCNKNPKFIADLNAHLAAIAKNLIPTFRTIKRHSGRNTTIVVLGYPHVFPTDRKQQDCAVQGVGIPVPPLVPPMMPPTLPIAARATPRDTIHIGWEPEEQTFLNRATDRLNRLSSHATNVRGIYFYNPTGYFKGHARCEKKQRWTNGLTGPKLQFPPIGEDSFHPTAAGHRAYRNFLLMELRAEARRIKKKQQKGRLTPVGLPANPRPTG